MDSDYLLDQLSHLVQSSGLPDKERKTVLRELVARHWGGLPPWSALKAPKIMEVEMATVGAGVAVTYMKDGVRKVVLAEAGEHYASALKGETAYMIPGGFINLTKTEGSSRVARSERPESGRAGAARETEEEFRLPDGKPLLRVEPERLKPMDTDTLAFQNGEKRIVLGFMLELTKDEITRVESHVARIAADPAYRAATAARTVNSASGKPEVGAVSIHDLNAVVEGKLRLLHPDQQSLFRAVKSHFAESRVVARRKGPTRAYLSKVKTLGELKRLAAEWREQGESIGVTSGAFDILHPGHISFLEDAKREGGRLVAIIASDRTIREQKGADRPYIPEMKRAQTIAALDTVDAVIVSDELYHETVLEALRPDLLFKGDDYKGKRIMGAELAGAVKLIPCAEKDFYSSSAFIRKIRAAPKP